MAGAAKFTLYQIEEEPHRALLISAREHAIDKPEAWSIHELLYRTRKGRVTMLQAADSEAARDEFARRKASAEGSTRLIEFEGVVILLISQTVPQAALDELTLEAVPKE